MAIPELGSVWRNTTSGILGTVVGVELPPADHLSHTVMLSIHPTLSQAISLDDFEKEWSKSRIGKDVSKWEHIKDGF